jgi:hypothetical protein
MSKMIATALATVLAGCAMNTQKQSPSYQYQVGFEQGCATAYAEARPTPGPPLRDAERYASGDDYRGGWVIGHDTCISGNPMWLQPFYR